MAVSSTVPLERLAVNAYRIPTERPESDGTLAWDSTTLVTVDLKGGGKAGFGYTYADTATARLVEDKLASVVEGANALDVPACRRAMETAVRNLGRRGIASTAIAAVDAALWDLKAKLLDAPLALLLGRVRSSVPVYGSGGFTSDSVQQVQEQLARWVDGGLAAVKMKVGRWPDEDVTRVAAAREAIGPGAELFVDANGAYDRKQALARAEAFAGFQVSWFEEPVSSWDTEGLRMLRDRLPSGMEVSAGEYGYVLADFRRLLEAGAVDVLQADASRCGISGFLDVAAVCAAWEVPLSSHTCPTLHLHAACAAHPLRHMEWFHDHVRIERMLFEGFMEPERGMLRPDLSRPGLGIDFRRTDAERFAV